MKHEIIIRVEAPADIDAITAITRAAFTDHPYSRGTEQFIINALRRDGALTVSLVAEKEGAVAGHIAFSPAEISDGAQGWFGLGPVSVAPEFQRGGIGSALVRAGLEEIKKCGAAGCVLVGDPHFYARFGFQSDLALTMDGIPQEFVQALAFTDAPAAGTITHHPAFHATE